MLRVLLPAALLVAGLVHLSAQAPAPVPAPAALPAAQVPPIPAAPTGPPATRGFTGACGLWFHPVRPERVADFERFLDYVRAALAKTANQRLRTQAAGWRFFKAAEAGPNGVALYVFVIDPAVPGAEYALGPILNEVYTDPAQLTEIWNLYQSSVTSGGTILNLAPLVARPPQPILAPPVSPAPGQKPGAPVVPAPAASTPPAPAVAPAGTPC